MDTPSLVPLITTYRDFFACAKSNLYGDRYIEVISPYKINILNHTTEITPRDLELCPEAERIPENIRFVRWWYQAVANETEE